MNAAQQALRDSLMVQRLAQDWPWEAIAEEAGITVNAAIKAVKKKRETAPMPLNMDPVRVIERIAVGLQLSIGDFEAVSARAALEGEYAAATTAKKAANDAREKLVSLLQATGRLPQDLATLRHLMDVREVGTSMVEIMESFRVTIEDASGLRGPAKMRAITSATDRTIEAFEKLVGFDRDAELGLDDLDDEAEEVTALPA